MQTLTTFAHKLYKKPDQIVKIFLDIMFFNPYLRCFILIYGFINFIHSSTDVFFKNKNNINYIWLFQYVEEKSRNSCKYVSWVWRSKSGRIAVSKKFESKWMGIRTFPSNEMQRYIHTHDDITDNGNEFSGGGLMHLRRWGAARESMMEWLKLDYFLTNEWQHLQYCS